jgi:CheY-like chemotaxis protein
MGRKKRRRSHPSPAPQLRPAPRRSGRRVVVADDDPEMRALLRCWLEAEGLEVDEVGDGIALVEYLVGSWMEDQALAGLRLVVTDQRMPGFDGTRVLEAVRAVGESVPVLLVTAFPEPGMVEHASKLGATAVLCKPVQKDEFLAAVKGAIGQCG